MLLGGLEDGELEDREDKKENLEWSMFAGEGPRVLMVLRLFTKVGVK